MAAGTTIVSRQRELAPRTRPKSKPGWGRPLLWVDGAAGFDRCSRRSAHLGQAEIAHRAKSFNRGCHRLTGFEENGRRATEQVADLVEIEQRRLLAVDSSRARIPIYAYRCQSNDASSSVITAPGGDARAELQRRGFSVALSPAPHHGLSSIWSQWERFQETSILSSTRSKP